MRRTGAPHPGAMTGRRGFLATASGVVAAVGAAALGDAPNVMAQPKLRWHMSPSTRRDVRRIA